MTNLPNTIRKIFIANRGEICRRVALTAKRMGIETACLTDRETPPEYLVGCIDHFISVESETVALYLDVEKMVKYALDAGADAVHPGYGFLSENERFAQRVLDAKLLWLGPKPSAMTAMAHKSQARELAIGLGVPCIQGLSIPPDMKEKELLKLAEKVAYPILLKAAKGGGGKGMRVVEKADELWDKAQHAFSEAKNAFGDGTLLLERYLSQSRHIEVQILGDLHANIVCVGDRDCSVQRRYQKIIEEAPALGLSEKTRQALYNCALTLSRNVEYSSCGTIEFLLDWSPKSQKAEQQDFFFLEMNTRLQVEHPVTECVFGVDLVEWQIRVARGEKLPTDFQHLKPRGHAIEVRVYAEDPQQNFFPSPGKVFAFLPARGPSLRWEIGLDTVDEVSTKFDPMVSKLIAIGQTRELSLSHMRSALEDTIFAGPITNLSFLHGIMSDQTFLAGPVDTHYLQTHKQALANNLLQGRELAEKQASPLLQVLENHRGRLGQRHDGDMTGIDAKTLSIFSQGAAPKGGESAQIGICYELSRSFASNTQVIYGKAFRKDGIYTRSFHYASGHSSSGDHYYVQIGPHVFAKASEKSTVHQKSGTTRKQNNVVSPVPGRILKILVKAQENVQAEQTLFVLDSMKMEFIIAASHAGVVSEIRVREGEQVEAGQLLANFKASD